MPKVMTRPGKAALSLALLVLLCLLAGCRQAQQRARTEPRPQRIVSLSPSVTEILYGIGAWPQVIAVSQFCTYPEDVKNPSSQTLSSGSMPRSHFSEIS